MPKANFERADAQPSTEINSMTSMEIEELIAQLQHSHNLRYKTLNLEFWALVSTMDNFLPGFWSRFLANRRTALKQFIQQKRSLNPPEF